MITTRDRMSLDEFLARPETKPASEYACGEATRKPMPTNPHAILQFYMAMLLHQFLATSALGRARIEWRCIFGPPRKRRAYVPDVAYVSYERMPRADARDIDYARVAPDLVIEVLSPRQPALQFAAKLKFYLANGVRLVWVLDPRKETITVFAAGEPEERVLRVGDMLDGDDVLPGFTASVDEIMAQLADG